MSWVFLVFAILFEVAGTTSLKLSQGFTRLAPSVAVVVCYACSFVLISFALRRLQVSVTYAIWSGVGTALIAIIGVIVFNESMTALKVASIALVILGIVGLNLAGTH